MHLLMYCLVLRLESLSIIRSKDRGCLGWKLLGEGVIKGVEVDGEVKCDG